MDYFFIYDVQLLKISFDKGERHLEELDDSFLCNCISITISKEEFNIFFKIFFDNPSQKQGIGSKSYRRVGVVCDILKEKCQKIKVPDCLVAVKRNIGFIGR